jgi:hypothetical protein
LLEPHGNFFQPTFGRCERVSGQAARVLRLRAGFTLQIHSHAFAADLNERMRHGAALALARIQAITFGNLAVKDLNVKFFGDDQVIDGYNEMVERLCDGAFGPPTIIFSSRLKLFHEPVGDVRAPVKFLLPVADAVDHGTSGGIDGVLIKIECTARVHDPVVYAIADQQ